MLLQEDRQHFSHSQLITMLSCPYKYRLQYIEGREWDYLPSSIVFGGAIHETLRDFHRALLDGTLDSDFAASFKETFAESSKDATFKDDSEYDELLLKGEQLITEYTSQFHHLKPLEVEMEFRLPLVNTFTGDLLEKDIVGRVDLVTDGDCVYELKTGSSRMPVTAVNENLQLILYGWAYRILYGRTPQKLMLVNLVKTKKPQIQVLDAVADPEREKKLLHLMFRVNEAIDKETFYPNPRGSYGCGSCCYSVSCEFAM